MKIITGSHKTTKLIKLAYNHRAIYVTPHIGQMQMLKEKYPDVEMMTFSSFLKSTRREKPYVIDMIDHCLKRNVIAMSGDEMEVV